MWENQLLRTTIVPQIRDNISNLRCKNEKLYLRWYIFQKFHEKKKNLTKLDLTFKRNMSIPVTHFSTNKFLLNAFSESLLYRIQNEVKKLLKYLQLYNDNTWITRERTVRIQMLFLILKNDINSLIELNVESTKDRVILCSEKSRFVLCY